MFEAAHKILPPVDYVSMIRSLYADRRSMLLGAFGSALAAVVAAIESGSLLLGGIAVLFVVVGVVRNMDMAAFDKVALDDRDVKTAQHWEARATVGAAAIALLYGIWCMVSFWFVDDAFAELTAACVSVSVLVGPAQRNFAIDRLMTTQVLLIAGPLSLGLLMVGDLNYALLTLLLLPFFISLRRIAGNSRNILLGAVHGRIEADALATQLDAALDTLEHGLIMLDHTGIIEVVNAQAFAAFDTSSPDLWVGRPFEQLCDELVQSKQLTRASCKKIVDLIGSASEAAGKVVIIPRPGLYFEVTVSSRDHKTVLLLEDISSRMLAEQRIRYMARFDALTGLPNRAHFSELVADALLAKKRSGERSDVALLVIDLDDFKHVNDTMGHLAGDHLLIEMGHRLRSTLGEQTICARLGGDEFVAFYPRVGAADEIDAHVDRLLDAMLEGFSIPDRRVDIGASIGAVISGEVPPDIEELMIKADLALYEAKSTKTGSLVYFHEKMDTEYKLRQELKRDLRHAIDNEEIRLVYQPIVDPRLNRIIGCEALARWTHPVHGPVSPATFIPIAEESGMVTDLSRLVLSAATRDCMRWPGEVSVAVNISARDFRAVDVEEMVVGVLAASGLPPQRLEIEVTETAVIDEQAAASAALQSLNARGVGIALDDFGTGYSSLSYLRSMPFTKLKIDRSFVVDIETDPQAMRLLTNVAQLGKDLSLRTTVEGVETEGQLALITGQTGVDLIQGFLYGPPLSQDAVNRLLDTQYGASAPALERRAAIKRR